MMEYIYSFIPTEEIKQITISKTQEWSNPEMQSMGDNWTVQSKLYLMLVPISLL